MIKVGGMRGARGLSRAAVAWLFPVVLTVLPRPAFADDDAPFAWLYTTEVGKQGEVEVEEWLTLGTGRFQESYDALAGRTELEYGASERLSLALYANYDWTRVVPQGAAAPDGPENAFRFSGFSG